MKMKNIISSMAAPAILCLFFHRVEAQTDNDAIMMNKTQWCNGAVYMHSSWDHYWEGTLKRDNANIGRVTTKAVAGMSTYGITDKLNVIASLPYVWTDATAGTLHGLKGFQDISFFIKWKPLTVNMGSGKLSIFAIGGISTPVSNYVIDFLPLSIGMGSTNLTGRIMGNYKNGIFFVRASASYVWRSNVKLDRTSYYTTQIHYTNQVEMPDQASFNGSVGIWKKYLIAELMVDNMTTLGGFDIRRNDMPFSSNRMNSTSLGAHVKYTFPFDTHIAVVGGGDWVLTGRNVGQSLGFNVGAFYAFYLKPREKNAPNHSSINN